MKTMKTMKTITLLSLIIIISSCSKRKYGYECEGYNNSLGYIDITEEHRDFEMTSKEADESIENFKNEYSSTHRCTCEKLME